MRIPRIVDVELTARCNLNCGFCFGPDARTCRRDLPFATWSSVLQCLARAGAKGIVVSGGEPTLRVDLDAILNTAKELGMSVVLSTNATRPQVIRAVCQHVDWLSLPIDAVAAPLQQKLRGVYHSPEHFCGIIESVRLVNPHIRIKIGTVVTQANIIELRALGNTLSAMAIDTWKIYQCTPRRRNVATARKLQVSDSQFADAVWALSNVADAFPFRVMASSSASRKRAYLFVYPDGTLAVPGVGEEDQVLGNIAVEGALALRGAADVSECRHEANYKGTYEKAAAQNPPPLAQWSQQTRV
ncbi:MAG: radical SAM protein [Lentisphaerae bacterium]|nr:radical SAM protein [Lentisphaerota bacterium]